METTRYIYRMWGTIESTNGLYGAGSQIATNCIRDRFGVTPYRVKMIGKKLTKNHTHRHFIAYFTKDDYPRLSQTLKANQHLCHDENNVKRWAFHRSDSPVAGLVVTFDHSPLKALPADNGQGGSYDVIAPTEPSLTPRRSNDSRRKRNRQAQISTPPSAGTPASLPFEVR